MHWPGRSVSAAGFSGRLTHFVSKLPIWLDEAAEPAIAWSPTTQRIAGSRYSLSASFTSSYPGQPPKHRLAQQPRQPVATVLAGARIRNRLGSGVSQAQRVIQLAVSQ